MPALGLHPDLNEVVGLPGFCSFKTYDVAERNQAWHRGSGVRNSKYWDWNHDRALKPS